MRRSDIFGESVHTLEALSMMRHELADAPEIVQRQSAVLAAAVVVDSPSRTHREVPVADRTLRPHHRAHFLDRLTMSAPQSASEAWIMALAPHHHAPMRQLLHRTDHEPSAPNRKTCVPRSRASPTFRACNR